MNYYEVFKMPILIYVIPSLTLILFTLFTSDIILNNPDSHSFSRFAEKKLL